MKNVLNLLKVKHYIKNLVIFMPLIYLGQLYNLKELIDVVKVFLVFCLTSSLVYVLNDITDIKRDQQHPQKCHRPLAAGLISVNQAKTIMGILALCIIIAGKFVLLKIYLIILAYILLNIAYSLSLKNYRYIDIFCIALGFVLRALTGFYAIYADISWTMIIVVFATSVLFTTSKRILELKLLPEAHNRRSSTQNVKEKTLGKLFYTSAIISVTSYNLMTALYCQYLCCAYITAIPFVLFITRLLILVSTPQTHDDPMNFIEKDTVSKVLIMIFLIALAICSVFTDLFTIS